MTNWRRTPTTGAGRGLSTSTWGWLAVFGTSAVLLVGLLVWSLTKADERTTSVANPGSGASSPSARPSAGATASSPEGTTAASPPPTGGVPTAAPPTSDASKPQKIRFNQTGQAAPDVDLKITKVESVIGLAQIPGEVGGPSLRLTVLVDNQTDKAVSIGNAVTNFYYGADRRPATPLLKPGSKAFPPLVPPNSTATGVLLFNVPKGSRNELLLEVNLDTELRTVEFNGACPRSC